MKFTPLLSAAALLSTGMLYAQTLNVKITNLTNGIVLTPLLVAAHPASTSVFSAGSAASASLEAMAEGGDLSGIISDISSVSDYAEATAVTLPAATTELNVTTTSTQTNLSIVAMLLPTNDGFVGLDSWDIPSTAGTYTVYLNGYDAGTEANDELITSIPADPQGTAGNSATGVTTSDNNTNVHIHRGVIGDTNSTSGISDLDSRVHRWLNPVAKVTIVVGN